MTELTPLLLDADPAKLPSMADPRSDRSEPVTVLASLQEIRKILHNSECSVKDTAQPKDGSAVLIRSASTGDEPCNKGTIALFAHTLIPLAPPSLRGRGAARAVLAVVGLALLGAMSLIAVRGRDLSHLAAGALGKGASRADDRPKAVARAALPPARTVEVVKSDAARSPTAMSKPLAAALATAAASWINPPSEPRTPTAAPRARAAAQHLGGGFAQSPIAVAQWSFRSGNREIASTSEPVPARRPLTLQIAFNGNLAAAEQIRIRGGIAIEVHWTRETSDAASGAPNLVTRLAIGNRGVAGGLAAEARRTGSFVWHGWSQKRSLSPGAWTVSLTYPDGQPLSCGNPPAPCRFHIAVD